MVMAVVVIIVAISHFLISFAGIIFYKPKLRKVRTKKWFLFTWIVYVSGLIASYYVANSLFPTNNRLLSLLYLIFWVVYLSVVVFKSYRAAHPK